MTRGACGERPARWRDGRCRTGQLGVVVVSVVPLEVPPVPDEPEVEVPPEPLALPVVAVEPPCAPPPTEPPAATCCWTTWASCGVAVLAVQLALPPVDKDSALTDTPHTLTAPPAGTGQGACGGCLVGSHRSIKGRGSYDCRRTGGKVGLGSNDIALDCVRGGIMKWIWRTLAAPALVWLSLSAASAQPAPSLLAQQTILTAEGARRALAAAEKEATAKGLKLSIAVVDASGQLMAFQRMDDARLITVDVSIGKARTAAYLRSPSKVLEDMVNGGRASLVAIEGITPVQGAVPIIANGAVVGAIGTSGATPVEDEAVAKAGAAALSKTPQ